MAFPKVTTAYVPPQYMPRILMLLWEHMENAGKTINHQPELTDWKVLDDRGGTNCYRILFPELNSKQVQKIVGKDIQVTQEDA